jgi:hypothetical protein
LAKSFKQLWVSKNPCCFRKKNKTRGEKMSFGGGGSSSPGAGTGTQSVQPYAAAQPALNQIISEAGQIYGSGVGEYVAPTQQTLTGLATQETMANAAHH